MLLVAEQGIKALAPKNRICVVCSQDITSPDDYIFIGYLGDPAEEPLGKFNFTTLHKSHGGQWAGRDEFLALVQTAVDDGRWVGKGLTSSVRSLSVQSPNLA